MGGRQDQNTTKQQARTAAAIHEVMQAIRRVAFLCLERPAEDLRAAAAAAAEAAAAARPSTTETQTKHNHRGDQGEPTSRRRKQQQQQQRPGQEVDVARQEQR